MKHQLQKVTRCERLRASEEKTFKHTGEAHCGRAEVQTRRIKAPNFNYFFLLFSSLKIQIFKYCETGWIMNIIIYKRVWVYVMLKMYLHCSLWSQQADKSFWRSVTWTSSMSIPSTRCCCSVLTGQWIALCVDALMGAIRCRRDYRTVLDGIRSWTDALQWLDHKTNVCSWWIWEAASSVT